MSTIKIKRSPTTGSPSALAQGEVAYSYLSGTAVNGGDRLYVGTGTETDGVAANIEVIGGKYFTQKLDHTPGVLTANSALIVDDTSKLDNLNVDNINVNGNSIITTNVNGNLVLSPNGTGTVDVDSSRIINVTTPSSPQDAANKTYVDTNVDAVLLGISGDTGTDSVLLVSGTLNFAGANGVSTSVTNDNVQIDVTAGVGMTSNTTGIHINESGDTSLTANSSGLFIEDSTLIIATSQLTGDVALGANTSGSYVQSTSGGTGVTVTGGTGESSTPVISIGQDVSTTADVEFNSMILNGNLTVSGTTTTVNSNEVNIGDAIILLNSDETGVPSENGGIEIERGTSLNKTLLWDEIADKWTVGAETFIAATFEGNLTGEVTGNASTATTLATARNIALTGDVTGSASFDGSSNINISTTVQPNSVALGGDTTGNYVQSVGITASTGLSLTGSGEGAIITIAGVNATNTVKGVASFASSNFSVSSGAVSISALDGGVY